METRTPGDVTIAILSDTHYAASAERARGNDYEFRTIANPLARAGVADRWPPVAFRGRRRSSA